MARTLAIAYLLTFVALGMMVVLVRSALPGVDGLTTFFYMNLVGLLMLPAAVLFFRGGRSSSGALRKLLAYGLSIATAFMGVGSSVAVVLFLLGVVEPS
ncbi:hypothetical protein [Pseudoxanthomonas sp. PXM02]|uniref:hypothetical protein n=1 Tax=Pseudoxanthomonas sp. PXM02 TaxID=2769294 RepID=UPI00177E523E|nr:hypothetical protein [Pseudoxanthomonas sp. PXM02]MBD9480505.1 hypothetical protein [Pseudoxanthomonas sp. PXM02]